MIHQHFVATILTILLVGTIPTSLLAYNNSGLEIGTFSIYNFAHAAEKKQTAEGDEQGVSPATDISITSSLSGIEKLQHKVKVLMFEASNARINAAEAVNVAGNATEAAKALASIADEADKDVRRLLKSVGDADKLQQNSNETEEQQQNNINNNYNDELNAALSEAKEKRKAANLAEKDARDLSDNADSLTEAANRAEKMARAAEKELQHTTSDSNRNIVKSDTNRADENENANLNPKEVGSIIDSDTNNVPADELSDKIETGITPLQEDRADVIKETSSDVLIRTSNNNSMSRNGEEQGLANGLNYEELLNEAKENALRTSSDQPPIGSMVNDSISRNQEQLRDGFPVEIPGVNSSTITNRISSLGETNKPTSNITASDNETGDNLLDLNPFGNSTDFNSTLISSSENDTPEFEGQVVCKVGLEDVTTNHNITSATTDVEDGGCYPQTSISGHYQYTAWSEGDEDNRYILFERRVNDRIVEDAITLSGNIPSAVFNPKVTSEGSNVYVVWQGDSESGNQDILMRKSENYGKSFGDIINLSNDRAGSGNPEINVNSSNVYVVWDGTTPGNNDIYFRKSVNNGTNFDKVRNLSTNDGVSYEPKVVLNKKGVEIYWHDYRDGHEEILARKTLNEGRTFEVMKNIDKDVLDLWKDRNAGRNRALN